MDNWWFVAVCANGAYYKYSFDPIRGGECKQVSNFFNLLFYDKIFAIYFSNSIYSVLYLNIYVNFSRNFRRLLQIFFNRHSDSSWRLYINSVHRQSLVHSFISNLYFDEIRSPSQLYSLNYQITWKD